MKDRGGGGASVMVPVGRPKDRFKYNCAMNFSPEESRCEVDESASVSFKGSTLDKPGELRHSLCRAAYLGAYP